MLRPVVNNYSLVHVEKPNLFRDQFPYDEIPKIRFDGQSVPFNFPDEIWITDTTFRDGQQSRPPYTPRQISSIYTLLHKLGGKNGIIRQSEFFIYSDRDRTAVELCLEQGYEFPEVTSWIRADKNDFKLVKSIGLKETGILTSVSDYHIFLKLKKSRDKVMQSYLEIVEACLDEGIIPRCHFEDITRADIYGFCLPFAQKLLQLSVSSHIPVKIRLCDTMGYGLPFAETVLPRSVPKIINAFTNEIGYPSQWLEWHGHNDFHKVHINGTASWLYGCSSLNASLLGYGERTGNPPLEAAIIEYISLTGNENGVDTTVITEIANYFTNEIHADIAPNYPFVGVDFNTTRAGIHADGILKNPEIYNIFDTDKILNRPLRVMVTDKSGLSGIARWLNENIKSIIVKEKEEITKRHPGVKHINNWVLEQYEYGRTTSISADELIAQTRHFIPSLFESDFDKVQNEGVRIAKKIAQKISNASEIKDLDPQKMEPYLDSILRKEGSIQLLAITNTDGFRISQVHTQHGEKALFRNLLKKNFHEHEWFTESIKTGEPYYSDLYFSEYTKRLIITIAIPVKSNDDQVRAIIDIDFRFDELVKLISKIPDEIIDTKS